MKVENKFINKEKFSRTLQRPSTHAGHLLLYFCIVECIVVIVVMILRQILHATGINNSFAWLHQIVGFITLLFLSKPTLRLFIKLYQHYAPESIRQKCICTPSCSEYALIVLKKYNTLKALKLIYIRLKFTCNGNKPITDYP